MCIPGVRDGVGDGVGVDDGVAVGRIKKIII